MTTININDTVQVTLTEYGLRCIREYEFLHSFSLEVTDKNILNIQLWRLMHIFGKILYSGSQLLFEKNEIRLISGE